MKKEYEQSNTKKSIRATRNAEKKAKKPRKAGVIESAFDFAPQVAASKERVKQLRKERRAK